MITCIMQPTYLPWIGYFAILKKFKCAYSNKKGGQKVLNMVLFIIMSIKDIIMLVIMGYLLKILHGTQENNRNSNVLSQNFAKSN